MAQRRLRLNAITLVIASALAGALAGRVDRAWATRNCAYTDVTRDGAWPMLLESAPPDGNFPERVVLEPPGADGTVVVRNDAGDRLWLLVPSEVAP